MSKKRLLTTLTTAALVAVMTTGGCVSAMAAEDVLRDGEQSVLKVVFPGGTSSPASLEVVEAQMNAVIAKYMDAVIDLEILEWGVFDDQQNLMLSAGEDIALMFTVSSTNNYAAAGKVMDITEMCDTYAANSLEMLGTYADACRIDGSLYGLPTFHEYGSRAGLVCRTDILEELGIDPASVQTWDDVETVMASVKEAYPDMNILVPVDGAGILDYFLQGEFDFLCNKSGAAAIRTGDDTAEVVNYFATEEFMGLAQKAYDWNQKGYFIADATTVTETRQELLAAGNTFGYIGQIHPGTATQELKNAGVAVTTIPVTGMALTTNSVNFAQYMVSSACSAPEKAVKLLDIMLTDSDMANLLMYGVEGENYVVKDETNNIVGYPEGVDSSTVGWNNETWLVPNGAIAKVWESDPANVWDAYCEHNASATVSPLYGFTFNTENVKTEITALTNIYSKYASVICAGYSEPEEAVAQMVEEQEAAGVQNIIDEATAQIAEWKAAK